MEKCYRVCKLCFFYVAQRSVAVVRASLLLTFVFIIVALSNTCSPWKTQFISWVVVFCLALLYCPHADVFPWEIGVTFPQAKSVAAEWTQSACQLITWLEILQSIEVCLPCAGFQPSLYKLPHNEPSCHSLSSCLSPHVKDQTLWRIVTSCEGPDTLAHYLKDWMLSSQPSKGWQRPNQDLSLLHLDPEPSVLTTQTQHGTALRLKSENWFWVCCFSGQRKEMTCWCAFDLEGCMPC